MHAHCTITVKLPVHFSWAVHTVRSECTCSLQYKGYHRCSWCPLYSALALCTLNELTGILTKCSVITKFPVRDKWSMQYKCTQRCTWCCVCTTCGPWTSAYTCSAEFKWTNMTTAHVQSTVQLWLKWQMHSKNTVHVQCERYANSQAICARVILTLTAVTWVRGTCSVNWECTHRGTGHVQGTQQVPSTCAVSAVSYLNGEQW